MMTKNENDQRVNLLVTNVDKKLSEIMKILDPIIMEHIVNNEDFDELGGALLYSTMLCSLEARFMEALKKSKNLNLVKLHHATRTEYGLF